MEIPKPTSFRVYVGTLVTNRIMGEPKPFICRFAVVMLHPLTREPCALMCNAETFENAAIEMDDIQYEGMTHGQNDTEYTVLEMGYKGETVVWDDKLPIVPVG